MANKRHRKSHTPSDRLLAELVQALENEREDHQKTLQRLVLSGPFECMGMSLSVLPPDAIATLRGECVAFLRSLIKGSGQKFSESLSTTGRVAFAGVVFRGRVHVEAIGNARDSIVVQLIGLLQIAGVERLRLCGAPFATGRVCGRLFVRTHKQKYCSRTCQNRSLMKRRRDEERQEIEKLRLRGEQRRQRRERT